MIKKFLYSIIFLSLFAASQEMDQEYLDSLPEAVRDDVLEKMEAKEDMDKPVYRRASTMIDKDEDELEEDEGSEVFGKKFFDTIQTSFMPINDPNLDGNYILDFGDVLEINLIGQEDSIDEYEIKRDGSINIPDIGKINLSGLALSDASDLVKAKVKQSFIGTEAFISLTNIRDINVIISGNAFNPGIYTLNGNSNMLHALSMAGGVNEFGSYRNIELIRNGKVIDTLDIYDVLIFGKSNLSKSLRSGDSILVNRMGKIVSIESGVLRTGKYELKDNESFSNLIDYANGLNSNADLNNLILKRVVGGESKVINVNYNQLGSIQVEDGDGLFIREYKFNSVTIKGAVKNPGSYILPLGTKLSKLIEDAGGYEDSAYEFGGFLNNKNSTQINQESKDKLYDKFLNNLILKSSTQRPMDQNFILVLEKLKDTAVSGRVIAEFDLDVLKTKPELDTILEDGDEIIIPNITQQVYIQGEVSNPGAIRYSPNKDINYYLKYSGGALDSADITNVYIVHPNGETTNLSTNSRLSFIIADNKSQSIYPGSIIYVPRTTNLASSLETASIWAPIISSVALSLTSLSVLNNSN